LDISYSIDDDENEREDLFVSNPPTSRGTPGIPHIASGIAIKPALKSAMSKSKVPVLEGNTASNSYPNNATAAAAYPSTSAIRRLDGRN
jgi:hypothetical protein